MPINGNQPTLNHCHLFQPDLPSNEVTTNPPHTNSWQILSDLRKTAETAVAEAPQVLEVFEMAAMEVSPALAVEQQMMMRPVLKLIPLQRLPLKMIEI